jgi:hypothetical protein
VSVSLVFRKGGERAPDQSPHEPGHMPCRHAQGEAHLSAEAKIVVHDDNWKWTPSEKYTWREHEGRGYWRDDKWVPW